MDLGSNFIFQQDNDHKHRSSVVTKCSREHLWIILDRRIRQRIPPPKNAHELKELLTEEWNQIGSDITEKLIDSVENRLQECLNQGRFSTRY
ncbi:unnamed protein product [Rotaria sordida]|uniref:Uncharacterized protein n=1 Tax=Rotaria sordida TaxID=392033 RepID=A0A815RFA8_9BILA|nr:unnamed protein product [Rotaria sordida]